MVAHFISVDRVIISLSESLTPTAAWRGRRRDEYLLVLDLGVAFVLGGGAVLTHSYFGVFIAVHIVLVG